MKRFLSAALAAMLLLCLLCAGAAAEIKALYKADVRFTCSLRSAPEDNAKRVGGLQEKNRVNIITYAEDWCYAEYKGKTGYLKTEWLWRFRSQDPENVPVPGYTRQAGIATALDGFFLRTEAYSGTAVASGSLLTVQSAEPDAFAVVKVARGECRVSPHLISYTPFPDWQEAAAGEIVYAYTTYFNEHFAKKLNDERIFNITEACKRITGQKVAPGATFSFNELCAPYRKSNGYKKAPNISKEGYGYGGGVCQVSTTLYNCVLGLPLRVDKWEVHRDSGVAYAPQCFDSAVGSYSDLAFTNLLPYTLIVEAYPQDGTLTVLLRAGEDAGQAEAGARTDAAPLGGEMMMLCDADQKCVSLYASSALNGEPGATVKGNTAVRVLERENDAVKVLAGEDEGWVSAGMLYDPLAMKEKKTKAKLNLRETPAADAPSMGTAAKGDTVFLLAAGREWALITADGVTGYVQLKYLK